MNTTENQSIMWNYVKQFKAYTTDKTGNAHVSYPLILKFVDGKAVGFVSDVTNVSDSALIKKLF